MKLLLSPHPDDETLFAAYTIMREKPLVVIVTHPTLQGYNGYERLMESYKAMQILGAPVAFLGIPEHELDFSRLWNALKIFKGYDTVYAPALDGGHEHHDLVYKVAKKVFSTVRTYRTYGKDETRATGEEVIPTAQELILKQRAMNCYKTQIENELTAHYFTTTKEYI